MLLAMLEYLGARTLQMKEVTGPDYGWTPSNRPTAESSKALLEAEASQPLKALPSAFLVAIYDMHVCMCDSCAPASYQVLRAELKSEVKREGLASISLAECENLKRQVLQDYFQQYQEQALAETRE